MIFVTVGSQLPFDRLLRGVDAWAARNPDVSVAAQTGRLGPKNYAPRHMTCQATLDPAAYDRMCREARLIVAHAGTGSLLKANALQTPILMMPRQAALNEHRNDHQMATADHFREMPGVHLVFDEDALPEAIDAVLSAPPNPPRLPEFAGEPLITAVRGVIFPNPVQDRT